MSGRVAIVSGANRANGIGQALVRELSHRGCSLVVGTYRSAASSGSLLKLAQRPGICALELDVTSESSVKRFVQCVAALADHVDILVNNAGVPSCAQPLDRAPLGEIERHIQTHALGMLRVTRGVLALMRAGSVVANVSSILSRVDAMGSSYTGYAPAKALQNAFTMQLAACLRPRGTITFAVHPGWVATDIGGPGAPVSADESAKGITQLIFMASPKDSGTFRDYQGRALHF